MSGKFDPQNAQNAVEIEKQFAVKAVEQAQTFWNLLAKVEPKELRLTKYDDEIFEHTLSTFPELKDDDYAKLIKIDEDWMKTKEGKERWRKFIDTYAQKIKDYNFGCLIRTNSMEEYGEHNTIFVMRMQFYAFEIARNRLGLNDKAHIIAKEEADKEAAEKASKANGKKAKRS